MLRCVKWFPLAVLAVFAAFCTLGWILVRPGYPVQVTLRAYNTKGQEIPVIIKNPEDGLQLAGGDWRLTRPVGSHLKNVNIRPKDNLYGSPKDIEVVWMTEKEFNTWLEHDLPAEMQRLGADANAIDAVKKSLKGRYAPGAHAYDYAIIFAPVKSK
jgi:hypothetical protein